MSSAVTARSAIAYREDMQYRNIVGSQGSPFHRLNRFWTWLRDASLNLRGDHHGLYPVHASMHHLNQAFSNPRYRQRPWSLGVYTNEEFYARSTTGRLTQTLEGSLVQVHATVSQKHLIKQSGGQSYVLPFDRFDPVQIPASGTWVVVIYDVDQVDAEPELVFQQYSVTQEEITTIKSYPKDGMLVPLMMSTAYHVHHFAQSGLQIPRMLWRLTSPRTGVVMLRSAAVEMQMEIHPQLKWSPSAIGDTLSSVAPIAADPTTARGPIVDAIRRAGEKHRARRLDGYYSTPSGQQHVNEPGNTGQIASSAMAVTAMVLAIEGVIEENADTIAANLTKIDPEWRLTSDNDTDALMNATLGVEALFMSVAPGGRKSPVLAELKRIFGDKGIPSLARMLGGGSGLPAAPSSLGNLQEFVDTVLATKIDMDQDIPRMISEEYMARALSAVESPSWTAGFSPLTLGVAVSAMPDNFVQRVQDVLTNRLKMRNAVLKHAGSPPDVSWDDSAEPGVYVVASLADYDSAAREMASNRWSSLAPTIVSSADEVLKIFDAPDTEVTAAQLHFTAQGPVSRFCYVQSNAISVTDPSTKLKLDPDRMREFLVIKDVTANNTAFTLIVDMVTQHSFVGVSDVSPDHYQPLLCDVVSAIVAGTAAPSDAGQRAAARVRQLAVHTLALQAYSKPSAPSSTTTKPSPELMKALRSMMGVTVLPCRATLDNGPAWISNVEDDAVHVRFNPTRAHYAPTTQVFKWNDQINAFGSDNAKLAVDTVHVKGGGEIHPVKALSVGNQLYVAKQAMPIMAAVQNSNQGAKDMFISQPLIHDPYGTHENALFHPLLLTAGGARNRMMTTRSTNLPKHVGGRDAYSLIMTNQERNDPSIFFGSHQGSTNSWTSPFA